MKKICHVSSVHKRYDQRIFNRECKSLAKKYQVVLVVNDTLPDETVENIKIRTTGKRQKNRFLRAVCGVWYTYKIALSEEADLYHLHDPELLLIAMRLKRKGKKVIFDSHEDYYEQIQVKKYIPSFLRKIVANFYYRLETYVCKKIDGVIMASTIEGKCFFDGRCKRYQFVNNLPKRSQADAVTIGDYSQRKSCIYAGSLSPERGISQIADAAEESDYDLILAGNFQPAQYKEEILKNKSHVFYAGMLDGNEIFGLYAKSAIGMSVLQDCGQYAKGDNLPTKVYEYMAMSMPVVLSDFPSCVKAVEKYHFGLTVRPDDPKDIAEKITYLVEHPEEAEQMGKNGRKAFEVEYNWDVAEKNLFKLYDDIFADR